MLTSLDKELNSSTGLRPLQLRTQMPNEYNQRLLDTGDALRQSKELFCINTDISLKALNDASVGIKEESLVSLSANGSNSVPLGALIHFAHQAFCYEQYEVLDILGRAMVKAAVECSDLCIQWKGKALSLVVMTSSMLNAHQPKPMHAPPNQPQVHIQMASHRGH